VSPELALAILSLAISIATFGLILALLFREKRDYAMRGDLNKLNDHVTSELGRLQYSLSQLYRYTEAVDAQSGGRGYQVLRRRVRRDHPEA
jgi:hypothetical protein